MARPLRVEYPGGVYHVTSRGNAQQAIFSSDEDRRAFLGLLASVVTRFHWFCHAYCLMDNHYHLVIETIDPTLSRGMRHLNGVYTQWVNRTQGRVGHLFQGRYKAIVVEKDAYLLELCRYVVLNPVRARMVSRPEDWPWSSYGATAGVATIPDGLTVEWVLGQLAPQRHLAQQAYQTFVKEGLGSRSPWTELKGQIFLGQAGFVERLKPKLKPSALITELPRPQRYAARPSLHALLPSRQPNTSERAIHQAHVEYGYTMREIADRLGWHYTTVSKIIKRIEQQK